MKPRHTALLVAVLALPVMAGEERLQSTDTPSPPAAGGERSGQTPAFSAGQILTLDENGKISNRAPQASDMHGLSPDALSTSSEGLVEEKNDVGGGYMVNLQGRFQNAMIMTVDENGKTISAPCVSGSPDDATVAGKVK
jgi:hypothetical protein